MPIYNELIKRVDNGEKFYINFEERTMKVGNTYLVKNGEYDTTKQLFDDKWISEDTDCSIPAILYTITEMYKSYKYSLPSERSERKQRQYFKALPIEELTDEQLVFAQGRESAQAVLEGFILCMILNGNFKWDADLMGNWYWQSQEDQDLVILKKWVENKLNTREI